MCKSSCCLLFEYVKERKEARQHLKNIIFLSIDLCACVCACVRVSVLMNNKTTKE